MLLDRTFDVSTEPVAPFDGDEATRRSLEQFVFREARLLDDRDFDAWLALWTAEGMYWVPRFFKQQSPFGQISLFWEDKMLREVRVRRITNERNWSQQPNTRTARLMGNIMVDGLDEAGDFIVHATFQLTEWRNTQRQLAGSCIYKLRREGGGWRIVLKRVDLVNSDDVFANLEVFI